MTHEADDAGEPAALPGEIKAPRKASMWLGVAMVCFLLVVAAGLAAAGYSAITSYAFVNSVGYTLGKNEIDVSYVPAGGCDQMVRVRVSETDDAVVLDLVSWKLPLMPDAPPVDCFATFPLSQPVGDRDVRMANGETIVEQ